MALPKDLGGAHVQSSCEYVEISGKGQPTGGAPSVWQLIVQLATTFSIE